MTGNFLLLNILLMASSLHGVVIALFLFHKRKASRANLYLAGLVFLYAVDLAIENTLIMPPGPIQPHMIGVIDPLLFLYGPLIFLYARNLISTEKAPGLASWLHFLPFLSVLVAYTFFFFPLPGEIKIPTEGFGIDDPGATWISRSFIWLASSFQELIYVVATLVFLKRYQNRLKSSLSSLETLGLQWLVQLLKVTLFLIGASFGTFLLTYFGWLYLDEALLILLLLCANLIYLIGYKGLAQPQLFDAHPEPVFAGSSENRESEKQAGSPKYATSGLGASVSKDLATRIELLMAEEQLYLRPDMRLRDLAERLNVSENRVSQAINENFHKNFYHFVNGFRIEAAKAKLIESNAKILDLAMASGFNSKSSFNAVFKKMTGISPGQFRKKERGLSSADSNT